jgi:hypothetical protein
MKDSEKVSKKDMERRKQRKHEDENKRLRDRRKMKKEREKLDGNRGKK